MDRDYDGKAGKPGANPNDATISASRLDQSGRTAETGRCCRDGDRAAAAAISNAAAAAWPESNDARGIAQMIRVGLYRPVHVKALRSQKLRMLLTHRELLQSKAIAVDTFKLVATGATQRK